MIKYCVLDDYGDEWETASVVFESEDLMKCVDWAEDNNYHSASIISVSGSGERLNKVY